MVSNKAVTLHGGIVFAYFETSIGGFALHQLMLWGVHLDLTKSFNSCLSSLVFPKLRKKSIKFILGRRLYVFKYIREPTLRIFTQYLTGTKQ